MISRPAELLADILEGALQSLPNQAECISTEDMLARIDQANTVVRKRGETYVLDQGMQ